MGWAHSPPQALCLGVAVQDRTHLSVPTPTGPAHGWSGDGGSAEAAYHVLAPVLPPGACHSAVVVGSPLTGASFYHRKAAFM